LSRFAAALTRNLCQVTKIVSFVFATSEKLSFCIEKTAIPVGTKIAERKAMAERLPIF
jgi:hypothetical protein